MNEQTQTTINTLLAALEQREQIARKDLRRQIQDYGADRFSAGRVGKIYIFWEASNKISFMLDTNGSSLEYGKMEEHFAQNFNFITTKVYENDIAPALETWLRQKVCDEEWGGLYDAKAGINTGDGISPKTIIAQDEKRLRYRTQLIRDFIIKKEYETENLEAIEFSFKNIFRIAATDLYDELGIETLTTFYDWMLNCARHWKTSEDKGTDWVMLADALILAAYALTNPKSKPQITEDMFHLACRICMGMMDHADEYRKNDACNALQTVAERGSKEARNILKFGSGLIASEITQYKDDLVTCNANDVTKIIDFKLKEESVDAYHAMLDYIIRLIKSGFPFDYAIKFNSREKNYIQKLPKTKAQLFWNNCARYPALWPKMKEYVTIVIGDVRYYSDEAAVPCGGYATFALVMASADNHDIMQTFMAQNDIEHSLAPDIFVLAYLEKYGINPQNAEALVCSIIGMSEPHVDESYEYRKKITGLDQPETLAAIADAMVKLEFDDYEARIVAAFLFGKANKPETLIKNADAHARSSLERILAMTKKK
ncbi:MAG: DUF6138 family protein [Azonexus sp.]|jgi:hypothetical protein|nr:DUF6138 family protein [Azonexus sp.]